jgi:hypothetical protein
MPLKHLGTLLALALIAAGYYAWESSGQPTPKNLGARALSAGDSKDRLTAAVQLSMCTDPEAKVQIRRVVAQSKDPDVQVQALETLGQYSESVNSDLCLTLLDHPEKKVRAAAFQSLARIVGNPAEFMEKEFGFHADDAQDKRGLASQKLQEKYKSYVRPTRPPGPPNASAPDPVPTPSPASAPVPSPDSTPSPAPSYYPPSGSMPSPGPMMTYENPAISFLAWMCRVLALLVLLAEVVGAIGLILGDTKPKGHAKDASRYKAQPPSVAEEVERILAKNNSLGLWPKVAVLVGGAVCVVALLIAAEMVQLAVAVQQTAIAVQQSAVRVEQKMDQFARPK